MLAALSAIRARDIHAQRIHARPGLPTLHIFIILCICSNWG